MHVIRYVPQSTMDGDRTLGRGTLGRGTLGREWKTRVDSRSGDLHRVDSRSGASLLNMNCSLGREITRGWTLGREEKSRGCDPLDHCRHHPMTHTAC